MHNGNVQSDTLKRPFPAYDGEEPYIFVSYAHKDAELVFPEIKRFHDEGYPVWYDQGLTPGQEWDDEVADALLDSSLLVIFISKNSMASSNVQDEIKLALEEKIDIVPIYLEETKLPSGLRLRLSNKHAIFKHTLNDVDYINDCFKAFNNAKIPKIDVLESFDDDIVSVESEHDFKPKMINDVKSTVHDVFISYSTFDKDYADSIRNILEANGINCWTGIGDILPGRNYGDQIKDALLSSRLVLCIFSNHAQKSDYVKSEIGMAFSNNIPIYSFKIDETLPQDEMEFYLKNQWWLDGIPNPENHYDDLVKYVKEILNPENTQAIKIDTKIASKKKVYICYDDYDKDIAQSVCGILEDYKFKCWFKHRDVGFKNIVDEIIDAIKDCDVVVLIYSASSMKSNFVNTEIDIAFSEEKPIFIFKVDDSKFEGGLRFFLNDKPCLDASSDYEVYLATLVNEVYNLVNKSKSSNKGLFKSIRKSLFK